ncbi:MAG: prefoldin subunit alpha [archaeon]
MDQEVMYKAQLLQGEAQELEQHLEIVEHELDDLNKIHQSLKDFENLNQKSSISSLGKGIHIRTNIESKDLLVEVGAGVLVKKTSTETRAVIENQIKRLNEARLQMLNKLAMYRKALESIMQELQEEQHNHSH